MKVIPFPLKRHATSGPSTDDIDVGFVEMVQLHAAAHGGKVAYTANFSRILDKEDDSGEQCLVIALPDALSQTVNLGTHDISVEVRTNDAGHAVACAMFADRRVAVPMQPIELFRPLERGHLHVLWVFKDDVSLLRYAYTEGMDRDCHAASFAANNYDRLEDTHDATDDGVVEVFQYFTFDHPRY
jgi:hypothetical protein